MKNSAYFDSIRQFRSDDDSFLIKMEKGAKDACIRYGASELTSWKNNKDALGEILENVNDQSYIGFEVGCPCGGRIDCMLFGKGQDGKKNVVHIELKQWDAKSVSKVDDLGNHQVGMVQALVGGNAVEIHAHPSKQAFCYQMHMKNLMPVFSVGPNDKLNLYGMSYCYNYSPAIKNDLLNSRYKPFTDECPIYTQDTKGDLKRRLEDLLKGGEGKSVADNFFGSPIRQTTVLTDAAADIVNGKDEFTLVGDQSDAEGAILNAVKKAMSDSSQKSAIIVKGGPGTGKTVIALKVLGDLLKYKKDEKKDLQVYYTTRSYALRDTLRDKLAPANDVIGEIYSFNPADRDEGEVDVLLVDEAHRIAESGNAYYYHSNKTGIKGTTTYLSQTMSLLYSAKVCVFFIDDHQAVNNTEIGFSDSIQTTAERYIQNLKEQYNEHQNKIKKAKNDCQKWEEKGNTFDNIESLVNNLEPNYFPEDKTEIRGLLDKFDSMFDGRSKKVKGQIRTLSDHLDKIAVGNRRDFDEAVQKLSGMLNELKTSVFEGEVCDAVCNSQRAYEALINEKVNKEITSSVTGVDVSSMSLTTQFRCGGSDNFIKWIDSVLYESKNYIKSNHIQKGNDYIFEVMDSPQCLESKIRDLNSPFLNSAGKRNDSGNTAASKQAEVVARLVSGWCWPWEDGFTKDGDLKKEVVIGDWSMPWETKNTVPKGHINDYAPSANVWASDYRGINQVGCIASAQGFEFDYVGVILGPDVYFDKDHECIAVRKENTGGYTKTHGKIDGENRQKYIRNIYRVLLTRGKKGCYIYCCDPDLNQYFKDLLQ